MAEYFDMEVGFEGDDDLARGLRELDEKAPRLLRELIEDSARVAAQSAEIYAPHGATGNLAKEIDHTRATSDEFGGYEAQAGVRPVDEAGASKDYPFWVEAGTGIYGSTGETIKPRVGNFMVFEYRGRLFVTKEIKGQEGRRYFESAYEDLLEYLPPRIEMLKRRLSEIGKQ